MNSTINFGFNSPVIMSSHFSPLFNGVGEFGFSGDCIQISQPFMHNLFYVCDSLPRMDAFFSREIKRQSSSTDYLEFLLSLIFLPAYNLQRMEIPTIPRQAIRRQNVSNEPTLVTPSGRRADSNLSTPQDQWTNGVEAHNEEVHSDARARNVQHEQSLPANAGARVFFDKVIEQYINKFTLPLDKLELKIENLLKQPANPERERILAKSFTDHHEALANLKNEIDEIEGLSPNVYLGIAKQVVLCAVQSKKPLFEKDRPTLELPLALHNDGSALEILRQQIEQGTSEIDLTDVIYKIAYSIQNKLSYIEAIKMPIESYLKSPKFQALKKRVGS